MSKRVGINDKGAVAKGPSHGDLCRTSNAGSRCRGRNAVANCRTVRRLLGAQKSRGDLCGTRRPENKNLRVAPVFVNLPFAGEIYGNTRAQFNLVNDNVRASCNVERLWWALKR